MTLCNTCKKRPTCREYTAYGELSEGTKCSAYDNTPLTNLDILKDKIMQMSAEEITNHLCNQSINEIIGNTTKEYSDEDMPYFLNQPYEKEKEYVVYSNNKYAYKCYLWGGNKDSTTGNIGEAWRTTLREANEMRNKLNNDNPTENWCIEEVKE